MMDLQKGVAVALGWFAGFYACPSTFAQHDPGRNAVREIAKGNTVAAIEIVAKAPKKSNSEISVADRMFVLAMAAMKDADIDKALLLVKASVDAGLPIERLQAGPRELFGPLYSREDYQEWLEPQAKVLLLVKQ